MLHFESRITSTRIVPGASWSCVVSAALECSFIASSFNQGEQRCRRDLSCLCRTSFRKASILHQQSKPITQLTRQQCRVCIYSLCVSFPLLTVICMLHSYISLPIAKSIESLVFSTDAHWCMPSRGSGWSGLGMPWGLLSKPPARRLRFLSRARPTATGSQTPVL